MTEPRLINIALTYARAAAWSAWVESIAEGESVAA